MKDAAQTAHQPVSIASDFTKTRRRVITRRGVLWLGQTCNLRCNFCYFLDRINSKSHPEHAFMSLDKAKQICSFLVGEYQNCAIDIQGGEPMIYPDIYDLVRYCRHIGLLPTLITNALMLDNYSRCQKLVDAGIRDLLISVHGLGATYDTIVGVPGAHARQLRALENLQKTAIPIRFNCVLSRKALPEINDIARLAIASGARVVNFIAFNPFEDQQKNGKRSVSNVPRYNEISTYLNEALTTLSMGDVEGNVRYLPFCAVDETHRQSIYNFQQLPYDIHEWDYASWSWTGMRSQRMRDGDIGPCIALKDATFRPVKYSGPLEPIANFAREMAHRFPELREHISAMHRTISKIGSRTSMRTLEQLYRENARMRANSHCRYAFGEPCVRCAAKGICDGFHGDYASIFGTEEAKPILSNQPITNPKHYIMHQNKVVEHEDYGWAL